MIADEITGKRLAVLKEMLPRASRMAVLTQVNHSASTGQVQAAREAAKSSTQLAAVAVKHPLPILCEWREMAEAGCLIAYGPNNSALYRRAARGVRDRAGRELAAAAGAE